MNDIIHLKFVYLGVTCCTCKSSYCGYDKPLGVPKFCFERKDSKWIYERSHNYLSYGERYEFMIYHRSYTHNLSSCEIKAWKNSGLNGIWTHDLCNTSAVLYQLSYQLCVQLWWSIINWYLGRNTMRNISLSQVNTQRTQYKKLGTKQMHTAMSWLCNTFVTHWVCLTNRGILNQNLIQSLLLSWQRFDKQDITIYKQIMK